MKPSDMDIAAAMLRKSHTPELAASDAMAAMPTTELDWSRTSMVCCGMMSLAAKDATCPA